MAIDIDLYGKVALVTGAGRGIGRAVAVSLAEAGADVCVTARTESQIVETAEIIRAMGRFALALPADAVDGKAVSDVVTGTIEKLGGLHLLINNAGTDFFRPLLEVSEAEYDRLMAVNVKSMFLFTRAAGRYFVQQKSGAVVNMASVGAYVAAPYQSVYHASKAAVAHFTKAMAIEWARYNIRVNAVAPGWIRTDLIKDLLQDKNKLERYVQAIPQRRLGEPDEIAPLVAFLCSDLSAYMTGAVVVIDGGLMIS
jgi:2-deoxy-D-gluconate 3-dehydrogenase